MEQCPVGASFNFIKSLVVCPAFGFGFNRPFLESLNNTEWDFKEGNWVGNFSHDPLDSEVEIIYRNATFNIEKGSIRFFGSDRCSRH